MYDPDLVQPMREEVTHLGVKELKTPADVENAVKQPGTTLIFVNSVCGCAAAGARPGLRMALMNAKKPANLFTVFAGMEQPAEPYEARDMTTTDTDALLHAAGMTDDDLAKLHDAGVIA